MKGTYFQRPLEFKIDVQGESWNQGDTISGILTVKNQGASSASAEGLKVELARGELKKVRAKSSDAFEILSSINIPSSAPIEPTKELSFPWSFQTERGCPITDASSSLFLLYGPGASPGQLQLSILPFAVIQEILEVFEIGFRFVTKSKKSVKGAVDVKLAPPDARAYAAVDQLLLSFRFEGDTLELQYSFAVKKVEASAASIDLKKEKRNFEQSFNPSDYKTPSGRFNHERIEAAVREVLSQVEAKVLF